MKLSASVQSSTHRALLFGPPKSGKSYLAGKLSSDFHILWFYLDNGVDTLRQLPMEQQERIELISLPDSRVYPIAIETMLKVIKGAPVDICEEHGKVACALCKKDAKPFSSIALNQLPSSTVVVVDFAARYWHRQQHAAPPVPPAAHDHPQRAGCRPRR